MAGKGRLYYTLLVVVCLVAICSLMGCIKRIQASVYEKDGVDRNIVVKRAYLFGNYTRVFIHEKERLDQEIVGNRGYLIGFPPPLSEEPRPTTREIIRVEIELPPYAKPMEYE